MFATLILSIGFQLGAAILAVGLARRTGWTLAWSAVALAMVLLVGRRLVTVWQWSNGRVLDPLQEGLVVSTALLLLIGIFLIGRSLRATTEMAETVRVAKEQADLANQAKTDFLANMSHELRTPLNAVIGFAQVMRNEYLGPLGSARYREYAAGIEESGQHLLEMIEDILDVSRIEAGQLVLKDEIVDVAQVMESVARLIRPKADSLRVMLYLEPPEDLPQLHGDARRLRQILLNLLSNAVKFTPAGGRVELRGRRDPQGGVILEVTDTGIGIKPADLQKVMSLFGQAQPAYTRSHPGSGLGLPIAHSLTELHDGQLSVESTPHCGTTVRVSLPASRMAAGDAVRGHSS
ncbi:MAG: HAMP domain-containing histidine kinase [Magnetospirillum sp.]|nr:HAMP domain-containing histidine kinase [Magnetospirillum sp.]